MRSKQRKFLCFVQQRACLFGIALLSGRLSLHALSSSDLALLLGFWAYKSSKWLLLHFAYERETISSYLMMLLMLMQRSRNRDYNLSNNLNEKCVWNRCVYGFCCCCCFNYNSLIDCILVGVILVWCCGWAAAAAIIFILTGSSLFYCFMFNAKKRIALHLVVGLLLHFHHLFCVLVQDIFMKQSACNHRTRSVYWCNWEITSIYLIYIYAQLFDCNIFVFFSQSVSEHDEC